MIHVYSLTRLIELHGQVTITASSHSPPRAAILHHISSFALYAPTLNTRQNDMNEVRKGSLQSLGEYYPKCGKWKPTAWCTLSRPSFPPLALKAFRFRPMFPSPLCLGHEIRASDPQNSRLPTDRSSQALLHTANRSLLEPDIRDVAGNPPTSLTHTDRLIPPSLLSCIAGDYMLAPMSHRRDIHLA